MEGSSSTTRILVGREFPCPEFFTIQPESCPDNLTHPVKFVGQTKHAATSAEWTASSRSSDVLERNSGFRTWIQLDPVLS